MKKIYLVLLLIAFYQVLAMAQIWEITNKNNIVVKGRIDFTPNKYKIFEISNEAIKAILWSAPHENETQLMNSQTLIDLPSADGQLHSFKIIQYDMMEKGLADRFPEYRTFYGIDNKNPNISVRMDYTAYGLRAVINEEGKSSWIEYYSSQDLNHRLVYYKSDYPKTFDWTCQFDNDQKREEHHAEKSGSRAGDCKFRTYRLANAATGEFSAFHGGTVALAQAAIVTIINRVNQVYETDLGVRMILVGNNTNIVYTNSGTDPYTNNNGSTMLSENQTTCDNIANIGSANYDIGHVFSTGGGGVAQLGVPCSAGSKAKGVTGLGSPVGDPFAIDYVAHEMGHQFGADHTFNSASATNGNCDPGNNNPSTSVEPGSGTTIMAYAGICAPVNVQNNSDAYFHAISIAEIVAEINTNTCDVETAQANLPPTVTNVPNFTIPISTSFVLTGIATDPNSDPLWYCWEQIDAATSTTAPTSTSTTQTQFRSLIQTQNTSRYFPKISDIVGNTTTIWEVLPTVSRDMNFRLTVRDHFNMVGCTAEDDVKVTTVAAAGPFVVNVLNSAPPALFEGQSFTVLWSVANTTAAPINAANVDIFLSYDGGLTYPTTLIANTPNDGSQDVVIPIGTTTTARIMVKASGNIFFDINNANFAINVGTASFVMTLNPTAISTCNNLNAAATITTQSIGGYTTSINLTATNLPAGATAVFSPATITPGQSSTLVLGNFGANTGVFNVNVIGTSGAIIRTEVLPVTLLNFPSVPSLSSPLNNAIDVSLNPTLTWTGTASSFEYQLSKLADFSILTVSGTIVTNTITISPSLDPYTIYYWRVRGANICGNSSWSSVRNFTTISCFLYLPSDLPLLMPVPTATATSTINIKDKGTVNDIDIINLQGAHTWIDDLIFTLSSPSGTSQIIFNQPCNFEDNYNINFDDTAASATYPCPPTNAMFYKPANVLSIFNTNSIKGNWKMKVDDVFTAEDGGQVNSYGLRLCVNNFCRLEVQNNNSSGVGSLKTAVDCASSGDTIKFASTVYNTQLDLGTQSLIVNKNLTLFTAPANNISMISNSTTTPTIDITGAFNVKIIGLKIIGSQFGISGIRNQGSLTLDNTEVLKNPSSTPTSLVNNVGSGSINLLGNCKIKQ